jgi:hypothetical protein
MRTELVSIATDTVPLGGALHLPEGRPVAGAVLLFHGNTMNFYVGAPRFLPPVLTRLGLACLAFNRRGHDIRRIRAGDRLDAITAQARAGAGRGITAAPPYTVTNDAEPWAPACAGAA